MGEHVRADAFRVVDISVQRTGGSSASFVRDPASHDAQLKSFFARTGADFSRFNYLGEWHSHPAFEPVPSSVDIVTMQSLVENAAVGVNFLVLLVVKLADRKTIECSAAAFTARTHPTGVTVLDEQTESASPVSQMLPRCLRNWSKSRIEIRSVGTRDAFVRRDREDGDK